MGNLGAIAAFPKAILGGQQFRAATPVQQAVIKAAKLYHEHQFPMICAALVLHIEAVQAKQAA